MENDVTISKTHTDNRLVLEVCGIEFELRNILAKLESFIRDDAKIEEVRLVCGRLLRIDVNLENEVWHGKNVVVHAREIVVPSSVCWDLSGKDNVHEFKESAGTGEDGTGLNGKDGYPGESGGNVLIMAKQITHPERMTIISNGGAGSNGQDGGNGVLGQDGKGLSWSEFEKEFAPVATMNVLHLKNTLENLKKPGISKIEEKSNERHPFKIFKNLLGFSTTVVSIGTIPFNITLVENYFCICKTDEGHKITFSFQDGDALQNYQAFLLYEGSPGTPGMPGGEYGLGGQGGRAGEVKVLCLTDFQDVNVHIISKTGVDGKSGKGGVHGRHGKKGWDVGYADHAIGRTTGSCPIYYGRDENSTLTLKYYASTGGYRIYCPYRKESSNPYVEITASKLHHPDQQTFEERNNSRTSNERQHHALAIGKEIISRQCIMNEYSEFMGKI